MFLIKMRQDEILISWNFCYISLELPKQLCGLEKSA